MAHGLPERLVAEGTAAERVRLPSPTDEPLENVPACPPSKETQKNVLASPLTEEPLELVMCLPTHEGAAVERPS